MKYLDLFSGIGGFSLAAESVGDFECVGFSEIDNRAISVYTNHFPTHKPLGDITKINPKNIPDIDFVFGGSPCQSFSIAGDRMAFNDNRGKLLFNYINILKVKQPKYFVFENVVGIINHSNGETFKLIINEFIDANYNVHFQIIESEDHGVPQKRHRVYVVGIRKDITKKFVFPEPEKEFKVIDDILTTNESAYNYYPQDKLFVYFENHDTYKPGRVKEILTKYRSKKFNQRKVLYTNGIAPTLTTKSSDLLIWHKEKIRQFTPIELEALQGFPPLWTSVLKSQSAVNYVIGNSITWKIASKIIRNIVD